VSWQATSWAARQKAGNTGRKALLLIIANAANAEGVCWVGRKALAEECECRPETVSANIAALEDAKLIARFRRTRSNGSRTTDWIVLAPRAEDRGEMRDAKAEEYDEEVCHSAQRPESAKVGNPNIAVSQGEVFRGPKTGFSGSPEPSTEQSSLATQERKARTVKHGGKAVGEQIASDAVALLALFNAEAGRKLSAFKANGQQSRFLTQIVGALLDNPDATYAEWEFGVRRGVASPPHWVKDRPVQLGDVFGPSAQAHTLTPPSARLPAARNGGPPSQGDLLRAVQAQQRQESNTIEGVAHDVA
jgi:hypothetical protein